MFWRWRVLTQEPAKPKVLVQAIHTEWRGGRDAWPLEIECVACGLKHAWWRRVNFYHNQADCPQCGQRGCFL